MLSNDVFGYLSIGFCIAQYTPYIFTILSGKTRPHIFSWTIWAITDLTTFTAQITHGAGPGAWATACNGLGAFLVICFSFKSGEKNITRGDWISFTAALLAIVFWYVTKNPLLTLILNIFIDFAACYPTLRKSYAKPWQENVTSYAMAALRSVTSLFAIEYFSVITAICPISLVILNGSMVFTILSRRAILKKS